MGYKAALAAGAWLGLLAAAAQSPTPRFEVVSIQALGPHQGPVANPGGAIKPGGEFSDPYVGLSALLLLAYRVRPIQADLRALPDWAKTTNYSIEAKPAEGFPDLPPAENQREICLMLQAMLADRFHVVVHHEARVVPAYEMTLAGTALKNATPGDPSQPGGGGFVAQNDIVRLVGRNVTMSDYGTAIAQILGRPIVDKTGLTSVYNFDVRRSVATPAGVQPGEGCGAGCDSLIVGTLGEELGLKLRATTALIDFLVLDHVEKPASN